MYNVLDVANYIISYCKERGFVMSNLKLQKVLYFVQAEFLVSKKSPCFKEAIEAWAFGPVVPEVYHMYKVFGSSNIIGESFESGASISQSDRELINGMVEACSRYSASDLVTMTHNQAPWQNAYQKYYNNIISIDSIEEYFRE